MKIIVIVQANYVRRISDIVLHNMLEVWTPWNVQIVYKFKQGVHDDSYYHMFQVARRSKTWGHWCATSQLQFNASLQFEFDQAEITKIKELG